MVEVDNDLETRQLEKKIPTSKKPRWGKTLIDNQVLIHCTKKTYRKPS